MYVYGVMRADAWPRLPEEGVAGRAVTRVDHGVLAALVGELPDEPVRPSRRNVMAHSAVLQHVVAQTDVLPMRFGMVMPGVEAVREHLLERHGEALRGELEAYAGCVELDVTVTCRQDAQLREALAADPALRAARGKLDAADYQARIAFGERVARAIEAQREAVAGRLIVALDGVARAAAADEPRHEDMLAAMAFLVDRRGVSAFETALEKLSDELGTERRVRCVGPPPPHHFAHPPLGGGGGGRGRSPGAVPRPPPPPPPRRWVPARGPPRPARH